MMIELKRRGLLQLAAAGGLAAPSLALSSSRAAAQSAKTLTIAYNTVLVAWDPTTGPASVNPATQSIYRSVFDPYLDQNPDLSLKPGLFTAWSFNDDKTKVRFELRKDAFWHDGTPVTPEDVIWSLERAADPKTGSPVQIVWAKLKNLKADGYVITADMPEYEPDMFAWLAFLTAYVLPKAYYTKVGAEGFEAKPIGSGPYMVDEFVRNSFVRLKAHPKYWGPKPAFETVVFKFIPDSTSRIAEIESGSSDITLEIPFDEYDRLRAMPKFTGTVHPISDIGMIFITNEPPMLDKNVRLAMTHAVDKKVIVKQLLRGYGLAIDTLLVPQYIGYDPSITVPYDPALATKLLAQAGFSPKNPVKFTIQTTRGFKPKDYECIQAVVGMWRKVGIEANIEVYEIAKHFELRTQHQLAPAAFYNWGNSAADPADSIAFAMFGPTPNSAWKTADMDAKIAPLWGEKDEAKRIAGYKAASRYIADEGYVLPLWQYYQPLLFKKSLKVPAYTAGFILPQTVTSV
jgi:peptide/nickel transport system substrate-binding protein